MKSFLCLVLCLAVVQAHNLPNYPSPLERPKYRPILEKILGSGGSLDKVGRITGGSIASRHQFPYQVYQFLDGFDGTYICGGSVISQSVVLTAAHCIDDMLSATIFFGANNKWNPDHVQSIRVTRVQWKMHENYDYRTISNDIGVISVSGLNLIPGKVEVINLVPRNLANNEFIGMNARVSGWGVYADGASTSNELRFVDLNIKDRSHCVGVFGPEVVRVSNVCTNADRGKSTCGGDSGGPLVLEYAGDRFQIGIVSYGAAAGCEKGYPSVFTRVASFLDWISTNTGL